jgi:hypothetical protein
MNVTEKVAEKLAERCGMLLSEAQRSGLTIREDSNDWAHSDDGFSGFIMWEEGPYDWPNMFWEFFIENEECQDIAAEIHTICGWGLIGVIEVH